MKAPVLLEQKKADARVPDAVEQAHAHRFVYDLLNDVRRCVCGATRTALDEALDR